MSKAPKFEIVFRNTTPYHSSQPGDARVDLNGNFVYGPSGFPCVRTRHQPVNAPRQGTDDDRKAHLTPIMPPNSLRHALREAMLAPIFEHFSGQHTLSIGAYAAAKAGSPTGNPDGVAATYAEKVQVSVHPFFGLFGGGPRMIEGKLVVDTAYPIVKRNAALLRHGLEEYMCADNTITFVSPTRRVDPLMKFNVGNEHLVANAAESVTGYINEQMQEKAEGDNSRGLNSFSFHEAVMPGVSWAWSVTTNPVLPAPTAAQLGLLLTAIAGLHGSQQGGMGRIGYGRVAIDSVLFDGQEVWDGYGLVESEVTVAACQAWGDALAEMSAADFESFAATRKADKAKAAKGKNKKSAAAEG